MNLQEKAEYFLAKFEQRTRPDGQKFYCSKNDNNEEARELVFKCHEDGSILPDDYRYNFMIESLELFCDCQDEDEARERISEIEPDAYTSDLTEWLNSSNSRVYYLTEVLEEIGTIDGFSLLAMAQQREKTEIADCVLDFLLDYED